jgi:hypothetical protein
MGFWGTIFGAIIGGLIAYFVQVKALRGGRRQRDKDQERTKQAQGYSLLFKMIRIHSDLYGIHQHLEGCLKKQDGRGLRASRGNLFYR